MNIGIIGSGNVGTALGAGWLKAGHKVSYGVREPGANNRGEAHESIRKADFLSVSDASNDNEVIVLTTPSHIVKELIPVMGTLEGKIVIDATNSVRLRPEPYRTAFHAFRDLVPGAKMVKCFNSTGFENMRNPKYPDESIDMFMAGSDAEAKETASGLSRDLGFENCYDFGGDDKVELLEQFALSWINLAIMQGQGRDIAFKLVRR